MFQILAIRISSKPIACLIEVPTILISKIELIITSSKATLLLMDLCLRDQPLQRNSTPHSTQIIIAK